MDPNYSILLSSFSKEELVAGEACWEQLEQHPPKVVPLGEEGYREIDYSQSALNHCFNRYLSA